MHLRVRQRRERLCIDRVEDQRVFNVRQHEQALPKPCFELMHHELSRERVLLVRAASVLWLLPAQRYRDRVDRLQLDAAEASRSGHALRDPTASRVAVDKAQHARRVARAREDDGGGLRACA